MLRTTAAIVAGKAARAAARVRGGGSAMPGLVANLLRASAGENAQEVALCVSQGHNVAKFRLLASSVLQQLQRGD